MSSSQDKENPNNGDGDYVIGDDDDDGVDIEDTIAEDELHEGEDDNDLAALQEEAEMDIEELRKKYYSIPVEAGEAGLSDGANATGDADDGETSQSELYAFIHTENGEAEGYDSDEDVDFLIDFYKPPRIGPEYQEMNIPEVQPNYKPCHDADLLWKPSDKLTDADLNQYQGSVLDISQEFIDGKLPSAPGVAHPRRTDPKYTYWDNEEALYVLMQNNYDVVKAKAAFVDEKPDVNLPRKTHFGIYLNWTEDDVEKFEQGLHYYGKRFWKIRSEFLPGRSIGEIVHFYYRYKKTERFDMFLTTHIEKYGTPPTPDHTDTMEEMMNTIQRTVVPPEQAAAIIAQAEEYSTEQNAE